MKKALLFLGLLIASDVLFAQPWLPATGSTATAIYNNPLTANVGIGTSNPQTTLDVNGVIHTMGGLISYGKDGAIAPGNLAGYFLGPSDGSSNIIIQGQAGTGVAFWLSATNGNFKIGGSGGSEPATGAINVDYADHVGINTQDTKGYMFAVAGSAIFTQAVVKLQANWPDYVFHKAYHLPSLDSIAAYIKTNNHLPDMPSAEEVTKNGIDLGANQARLLEKIEQLTLYTIELQKRVDLSQAENKMLSGTIKTQDERFAFLQQQIDELKKRAL
jgi:hypothetical protein